ncbi:MAG: VWA-like domain-containing protein [Treponema sp.]|nr:VWA-like domain-containing protein [Treponema sp.]
MSLNAEKRLSNIISQWFYSEPLLFSAVCTHSLICNDAIAVPLRSGNRRIEFNSSIIQSFNDETLQDLFKVEVTRILLGHPYLRRPHNAKPVILSMASDCVIWQLSSDRFPQSLPGVQYIKQQCGCATTFPDMNYDQWYKFIFDIVSKSRNGSSAGNSSIADLKDLESLSDLWNEDEQALNQIKSEIQKADISEGFGELGGDLQRELKSETDFAFDYRRALAKFRQNAVSPDRKLTRMRPSRRYGFKAMGSRYERKADILIAVDVSGSITDESFEHFIHAVKNFFYLGIIEKIDLIFFDVNLKLSTPVSFRKKIDLNEIKGRGGTNFQVPVDFYSEHKNDYSGMIVFTDGEGNPPVIPCALSNILWILDSRINYEKSRQWITKSCNNQAAFLPF